MVEDGDLQWLNVAHFHFMPHENLVSALKGAAVGVTGIYMRHENGQSLLIDTRTGKESVLTGEYQRPNEGTFVLALGNLSDLTPAGQPLLVVVSLYDLSEADRSSWNIFMNNLHRYNSKEYTFTLSKVSFNDVQGLTRNIPFLRRI
jgi:hypothetical protein